jgi:hypothetical protein
MVAVLETENKKNMRIVLEVARQFGVSVHNRRESGISKNYKNPSPSNDPWWDIPENNREVDNRIKEMKNGAAKYVSLENSELQAIFARCRE